MLATSVKDLIPVSAAMLSHNADLGIDIYYQSEPSSPPVLFLAGNEKPDINRLAPLVDEGAGKLFIRHRDKQRYQQYLRDNWRQLIADDSQKIVNRLALMSAVIRDVLREEFASRDTAKIVFAAQELGAATTELVGEEVLTARELCRVLHHDYGTFTHSTNVALYCILLARELGYPADALREIAVGGLLHDLGKLYINERILNKPGRLDDFEIREIRKHPLAGFRELVLRPDLTFGQLMMAYQHHERLDGSGYPVGCEADEIHPWAQMCAIVDVYEALTSQRPYRRPASQDTAVAVLNKDAGQAFDPEMLRCWTQLVKPQR